MGWSSHTCAPGIQGMSLQLTSHLQGNRKRKRGRSLSLNNVRTRIKDRRHRIAHSPHPQRFSPLPSFPPLHSKSSYLFFSSPTQGGGGGRYLLNPTLERSGQNYLSWHPQIMAPISFRSDVGCKVYHGRLNLPSLSASFPRKKLPTLTLTPLPRLNRKCFQSPQIAVRMSKGFVGRVSEKSNLQHAHCPSTL